MKGLTVLLLVLAVLAVAVTLVNYLPEDLFRPGATVLTDTAGPDSLKGVPAPAGQASQTAEPVVEEAPPQKPAPADSLKVHVPQPLRPVSQYSIEIQKSAFKLVLQRDGKPFKVYDIAIGNQGADKLEKADMITPLGEFHVVSIENSSQRSPKNSRSFGPWFIRLLTGHFQTASGKAWSGIGIQGGASAGEIGRSLPTDCVLLQDNDIKELKEYIDDDYKEYQLPVRIIP